MINGWKTKVCFHTNDSYCDADSIEVNLPSIPRVGDVLWLTATLEEKLLDKILDNGNEMDYYPQAAYGGWGRDRYEEFEALPREMKKEVMQFCDFINVELVIYDANTCSVIIALDD